MNRLVIAILFIVIAIALGVTSLIYVENTYKAMNSLMEQVSENALANNQEKASQLLEEAENRWNKHKKLLNIFLGQGETTTVISHIKTARQFAAHGNMESTILYTYECQVELYRIRETNRPSWSTIL